MAATRIGSLFSGAGGLDMAVEQVFGGHTVWHCEVDPAASKVLAHRWPGVPNHSDITTVDWAQVEPVDILCGGWPCQPFSLAGKRKGADDERALWPYVARAVRMVRPRIVVLENVSAVLGPEFQRVANDLAALGYDIAWTCLRASDVGAPHRRERVFIVATDANKVRRAAGDRRGRAQCTGCDERTTTNTDHAARDGQRPCAESRQGNLDTADPDGNRPYRNWAQGEVVGRRGTQGEPYCDNRNVVGRHEGQPEPARLVRGSDVAVGGDGVVDLLPTPAAARSGRNQSPSPGAAIRPSLDSITELLQTPSTADGDGSRKARGGDRSDEPLLPGRAVEMAQQWGKYEPAIRRWESVTCPAPAPTEPNKNGNPRLAAAFSEWLMGWPAGWVTAVPGISRNDQLRIVGNGVVPQCAASAICYLLSVAEAAA